LAYLEEAAHQLLDERIAERKLEAGANLSWAKPYVHERLAALERGEFIVSRRAQAPNAQRTASSMT